MISSLENQTIKLLCKLNIAKYRKKEKKFIVEGRHLVNEAKMYGYLIEAFSLEDKEGYTQITESVMKKICNTDTLVSEIGLCKMIDKNELANRILILDGIQDPGNMGTLMRSAVAFGFKTIALGNGTVDIYNDKVIRSSQGAIFKLNFINADLTQFIPTLNGYKLYGTNVENGHELDDIIISDKMAIVLGNEGNGISPTVNALIKENIYIPMENTESLNVGVAGGIIMYMLRG